MSKQLPWEYHPHLTEERLIAIAMLIRQGRHDAVEAHNPEIGDDTWTLGCCAFKYGHFRINQAAAVQRFDWLGIIDPTLRLIFSIGAVPVRFYSGDGEDPTSKTCKYAEPEHKQLSIAFPGEKESDSPLIYRFAVEQDPADGSVMAIKFVGVRDQRTVLCWDVPLGAAVVPLVPDTIDDQGVELGAPPVGLPGDDEEVAKRAG